MNSPSMQEISVDAPLENKIKTSIEALIDSTLKTHISTSRGSNQNESLWFKTAFENKAVKDIRPVVDFNRYSRWSER